MNFLLNNLKIVKGMFKMESYWHIVWISRAYGGPNKVKAQT